MRSRWMLTLLLYGTLAGTFPRLSAVSAGSGGAHEGVGVTEVALERAPSLTGGPYDQIILRSDGWATLKVREFIPPSGVRRDEAIQPGRYEGRIDIMDFEQLVRLLEVLGFWRMKLPDSDEVGSDSLCIKLRVVRQGKERTVTRFGNVGPVSFWGLEKAVLGVTHDIRWRRIGQ